MKIQLYPLLFVMCILLISCDSNKATTGYSSAVLDGKDAITTTFKVNPKKALPDACSLLDTKTIGELFNVNPVFISAVDGNPEGNKREHSACFFKWDDPNYPNAGILIQLQSNTKEMKQEGYDEWMAYSVANKRTTGETMMGESEPHIFNLFPNVGSDGSYNYEIGKYYWRIDNDLLIMLAYNMQSLDITEEKQLESAYVIAGELMNNLSKKPKPKKKQKT